jgi:hypothetical protein
VRKILIIGMVDSIHTAHWVERVVDLDCEIHIYPSRTHRKIHPLLRKLLEENRNLRLLQSFPSQKFSPYVNYLIESIKISSLNLQSWLLKRVIEGKSYSHIHCLEIQHAGYLLLEAKSAIDPRTQVICTNWGSDIYYYSQFDLHLKKIKEVLNMTDLYAAECVRDYELAKELGFCGQDLPLIPNSFKLNTSVISEGDVTTRSQIITKCYGGIFGLGVILIRVMDQFLETHQHASVLLYSVTDDLLSDAQNLVQKFPNRVRISTIRKPMPSSQIAAEFQKSRIYVGASRSDGISTSFLEAMNYGAFPIQTNTSCAQDWIAKGCVGRVVEPSIEEILITLNDVYDDFKTISNAAKINLNVLKKETETVLIKEIAKSFYR